MSRSTGWLDHEAAIERAVDGTGEFDEKGDPVPRSVAATASSSIHAALEDLTGEAAPSAPSLFAPTLGKEIRDGLSDLGFPVVRNADGSMYVRFPILFPEPKGAAAAPIIYTIAPLNYAWFASLTPENIRLLHVVLGPEVPADTRVKRFRYLENHINNKNKPLPAFSALIVELINFVA